MLLQKGALLADPSAADRLRQALVRLASSDHPEGLTVTALCQIADVSRNSLYRYHPEVLHALREHQRARPRIAPSTDHAITRQRAELADLRQQVRQLAALIDHYYAAYREAQALLSRREQELAELRRRLDTKPARLAR